MKRGVFLAMFLMTSQACDAGWWSWSYEDAKYACTKESSWIDRGHRRDVIRRDYRLYRECMDAKGWNEEAISRHHEKERCKRSGLTLNERIECVRKGH